MIPQYFRAEESKARNVTTVVHTDVQDDTDTKTSDRVLMGLSSISNPFVKGKDTITAVLTLSEQFTVASAAPLSSSLSLSVNGCAEFATFQQLFDEFRVDKIEWMMDLASACSVTNIYGARPTQAFTFTNYTAPTSWQAATDNSSFNLLDPCPGHFVFKHMIKPVPMINVGISPFTTVRGWQQTTASSNWRNGIVGYHVRDACSATFQVPYFIRFYVSFRGRRYG